MNRIMPCVSDLATEHEDRKEAENEARIALLEELGDAALKGDDPWNDLLEYMAEDDHVVEMFNILRRASVEKRTAESYKQVGEAVLDIFDDIFDRHLEEYVERSR